MQITVVNGEVNGKRMTALACMCQVRKLRTHAGQPFTSLGQVRKFLTHTGQPFMHLDIFPKVQQPTRFVPYISALGLHTISSLLLSVLGKFHVKMHMMAQAGYRN